MEGTNSKTRGALSALVLGILALVVLALWLGSTPSVTVGVDFYHTLRLYGHDMEGAGDFAVRDPVTSAVPEDPPYTDTMAVFNPQRPQAPRRDSLTWNPIWMSEAETVDENGAQGLYSGINTADINASEKVWFRMWYEPEHWDKDLNANGELDRDVDGSPFIDEWYPAIMQEFTYLLMEGKPLSQKPEPTYGPAGGTSFVFPVGIREADLNSPVGYGLTSLDANFDGVPDIVHVESELTLFNITQIAADFDGDGVIDPLDTDGNALSGDELAVLRLDGLSIPVGGRVQFLEHYVELKSVFNNSVLIDIWYNGSLVPRKLDSIVLYTGDMALAGVQGPAQVIQAVPNGGTGTNLCNFPRGPFFAQLITVDTQENTARLMLGRAVGATHSAMEDGANNQDRRPGDPWFLKRFYVDGHEYNVVAIKTDDQGPTFTDANCDLDDDNDGNLDDYPPPDDPSQFQFITIRTPIPKVPVTIEQHSVTLQDYPPPEAGRESAALSVMPPYNYEHFIILDVQKITSFGGAQFLGKLVGPVPPILQANVPTPYEGVGPYSPYNDPAEMRLAYLYEDRHPPFLGKLRERYAAGVPEGLTQEREFWYVRQWFTRAWEYTEFVLPDIRPDITGAGTPDLYLVASGYFAPQAQYYHIYQGRDEPRRATGGRVKFWFDPSGANDLYVSQDGARLYGRDGLGPGDLNVTHDPLTTTYPVEVLPYTDPWAPFDPLLPQAPRKDILTLDPAYMNEYAHGGEPISVLYGQIAVENDNAREKVFPRMWYEPEYLDKILRAEVAGTVITPTQVYTFPALMQEFTYMLLDTQDQPTHGQPGSTRLVFPMATGVTQLPAPVNGALPPEHLPSFGYGITTFDANFDGWLETVAVHSERSLYWETGVLADFDGDGDPTLPNTYLELDQLDTDGVQLTGDELVIFTVNVILHRGGSAQFLDHLVSLENVASGPSGAIADLEFWYAGGGINPSGGDYSIHPQKISTPFTSFQRGDMAIVNKNLVQRIAAGSHNLGSVDGGWFAYVRAINTFDETVYLTIGRALGATHSAIDDGAGFHDELPGDPWYLKRFFVDGHEYNVVAVKTAPSETPGIGEDYEFKYITIRTPVPKPDDFVNHEDSLVLQGYLQGTVFDVDTNFASVMPPFNVSHTLAVDIVAVPEDEFANPLDPGGDCQVNVLPGQGPLQVELVEEDREPRFFGELKEKLWDGRVDCGIVINEVLYDEAGDDPNNEFVELYNSGPAAINVGNYCLSDQDGLVYCLPSFVVQPGEYVVIYSGTGVDQTTTSPYQLYMGQVSPAWDDDGDEVLLHMESGETAGYQASEDVAVDFVEYEDGGGSGTGVPDGFYWVEDSASPNNGGGVGTSISLYPNGACSDLSSSWHQSGTGNTVGPSSAGANNNAVAPPAPGPDAWGTEQFHTWPDQYTQIRLPQCRRGLITSDWTSDLSRLHYYGCDPQFDTQDELHGLKDAIPATNEDGYFQADPTHRVRLEFWYDPCSPDDPYGNDRERIPTVVDLSGFGLADRPAGLAFWVVGGLGLVGLALIALGWRRRVV